MMKRQIEQESRGERTLHRERHTRAGPKRRFHDHSECSPSTTTQREEQVRILARVRGEVVAPRCYYLEL